MPTPTAIARSRMGVKSSSRCSWVNCFESCTPLMNISGAKTTAAATTGPAIGPTPASSTPATASMPSFHKPSFVTQVGPLAHRDLRHPLQARLANRFGDASRGRGFHGGGWRSRRSLPTRSSRRPARASVERRAGDFDRADIRQFHLAPRVAIIPALFDHAIGSETPALMPPRIIVTMKKSRRCRSARSRPAPVSDFT